MKMLERFLEINILRRLGGAAIDRDGGNKEMRFQIVVEFMIKVLVK
jgi:hypothetical protein